jgi:NADH:ubiquinone oxidoreductase subunit 5 (subunit L)/multisubunit Na+/H+ antiporter MnhA subunit
MQEFSDIAESGITLYQSANYTFALGFFFDLTGAVFFAMTCITTLLVMRFSTFYMHRDRGFKRFFATVLLFFSGLGLIVFAGNFETLFIGWEFIGITSFLLIAFYRDRYLPVKNALKVFSLYRIADACLLLALWYAHHVFERNINFSDLTQLVSEYGNNLTVLGLFLLIVALVKSAQFPFSYWLPRAMEGPTTSSAIFYGALSVHMGLFLLLRTFPLWEGSTAVKGLVFFFGLLTALICTSIARVQSSIKTQIAYASVTQIGIMFMELALGLHSLVLIHFASNALLRTYQLLISPSILSYLIHEQFYHFVLPPQKIGRNFLGRLRSSLYILAIKEWNMDRLMSDYLFKPLIVIGQITRPLSIPLLYALFCLFLAVSVFVLTTMDPTSSTVALMGDLAAGMSILMYLRAFPVQEMLKTTWHLIFLGHLYGIAFLFFASPENLTPLLMYAVGIGIAFVLGYVVLHYLQSKEKDSFAHFQGHIYEYRRLGNFFFIISLCFMAFPITPSFLGQEILLGTIHGEHMLQIVLFGIAYVISGITIIRLFAKVFFGPHQKTYHEVAYKSS